MSSFQNLALALSPPVLHDGVVNVYWGIWSPNNILGGVYEGKINYVTDVFFFSFCKLAENYYLKIYFRAVTLKLYL